MSSLIEFIRSVLDQNIGNYIEVGTDSGTLISNLAQQYADRVCVCIDSDQDQSNNIMLRIQDQHNIWFYSMTVEEYNRSLTTESAQNLSAAVVYIRSAMNYTDYAAAVQMCDKLLSARAGVVILAEIDPVAKQEFSDLLGYRVIKQYSLENQHQAYVLRTR